MRGEPVIVRQVPTLFFSDSATLTRISKLIKGVGKHHPLKVNSLQRCEGWHGMCSLQTGQRGLGLGFRHSSSTLTAYICRLIPACRCKHSQGCRALFLLACLLHCTRSPTNMRSACRAPGFYVFVLTAVMKCSLVAPLAKGVNGVLAGAAVHVP